MNPKFSLVYLTYRPGGIDLLGESLKYQKQEFELIVIDDYKGRVERGEARKYLEEKGINLRYYGKSKPHSYSNKKNGLANAMNSGALQASTNYLVFVHDFVWFPPGAIVQWLTSRCNYPGNTLISGIASLRNANSPEREGDISIWNSPYDRCASNIFEETHEWVPGWENFYCGIPMKFLEDINGFDERGDCGDISWPYYSTVNQARMNGYNLITDKKLRIDMVNHRKWTDKGKELWHAENMSDRKVVMPKWDRTSQNPYNFKTQTPIFNSNGVLAKINDLVLEVPNDHVIGPHFRTGSYEPLETRLFTEYLKEGDTVLDVGANIGYYTYSAAKKVGPTGNVIAIEPCGANFRMLKRNADNNQIGNVSFHMVAAGKERKTVKMYYSTVNAGDSRLWQDGVENRDRFEEVAVRTVDDILENQEQVNLIKMDVQGCEVDALLGSEKTISKQSKMALAVEYWPWGLKRAGSNHKDFLDIIYDKYGFQVYWLDEDNKKSIWKSKQELEEMINPSTMNFANLWCVKD